LIDATLSFSRSTSIPNCKTPVFACGCICYGNRVCPSPSQLTTIESEGYSISNGSIRAIISFLVPHNLSWRNVVTSRSRGYEKLAIFYTDTWRDLGNDKAETHSSTTVMLFHTTDKDKTKLSRPSFQFPTVQPQIY